MQGSSQTPSRKAKRSERTKTSAFFPFGNTRLFRRQKYPRHRDPSMPPQSPMAKMCLTPETTRASKRLLQKGPFGKNVTKSIKKLRKKKKKVVKNYQWTLGVEAPKSWTTKHVQSLKLPSSEKPSEHCTCAIDGDGGPVNSLVALGAD